MLHSFQVRNFRIFQHIEVRNLGRVNLVVGRNNAGKSTFLEALELYASNVSADVLLGLVEARQETWFSEAQPYSQDFLGHPFRHLFFGRKLPEINERGISLGEVSSNKELQIRVAAYQYKSDAEDTIKRIRVTDSQIDEENTSIDFFLVVEEEGKTRRLLRLDGRNVREMRRRRGIYSRQENAFKYKWQIVSTENMPNRKLAELWDLTSLTNLESEVISALRLIDSRVSRIAFVEDSQRRTGVDNRLPLVKIAGIDEPLPLKSMGDGMTRLFHIAVALVNAQNGLLLIDEFENVLHWRVQPKVWDIVFQLAERLNVQVFATTHSRDCLQGFDNAWNKYPKLGAFFRLDTKDGLIKATEYTSETLTDAIEMDVEVR